MFDCTALYSQAMTTQWQEFQHVTVPPGGFIDSSVTFQTLCNESVNRDYDTDRCSPALKNQFEGLEDFKNCRPRGWGTCYLRFYIWRVVKWLHHVATGRILDLIVYGRSQPSETAVCSSLVPMKCIYVLNMLNMWYSISVFPWPTLLFWPICVD